MPSVTPASLQIEHTKNTAAEIARVLVDEIKEPGKLHQIASLLIDGAKAKEAAVKAGEPKRPIAPAEHGPKELAHAMSPDMFATPIVPVKPAQEDYARIDREIGPLPPNPRCGTRPPGSTDTSGRAYPHKWPREADDGKIAECAISAVYTRAHPRRWEARRPDRRCSDCPTPAALAK
jgi:hypothetical protein